MKPLVWKIQLFILLFLFLASLLLTFYIWLSPTAGYMQSGILQGADLRGAFSWLLWISVGVFALSSSLSLQVCTRFTKRWPVLFVACGIGALTAMFVFRLIER